MNEGKLKELLLYNLEPLYKRMFGILKSEALDILPAVILIGAFLALFFGMDFGNLLKRAFMGVMAIFLFHWFFTGAADVGFMVGDKLLSKENHVLKSMGSATTRVTKGFHQDYSKRKKFDDDTVVERWGKDFVGWLIWILSNFALWFVRVSFTIAYYMPLILIPVIALVSIIPVTSKAIEGAIFTSIWIMVTPIVVAVLLELLNGTIVDRDIMENASWISKALMGVLFALYLVSSFSLSSRLIGKSGISEGISAIGQSYGAGMVMASQYFIMNKAMGMGKSITKMAYSPFDALKTKAYKNAELVRIRNPELASQIKDGNSPNRSRNDEAILMLNTALNPIKATKDHLDRKSIAKLLSKSEKFKNDPIDHTTLSWYRNVYKKPLIEQTNNRFRSNKGKDGDYRAKPSSNHHKTYREKNPFLSNLDNEIHPPISSSFHETNIQNFSEQLDKLNVPKSTKESKKMPRRQASEVNDERQV